MNFSIAQTIHRLCSPQHELSCSWWLWRRLIAKLRERGLSGGRESGAFLLGRRQDGRARVVDFVLYDDLDPRALDTGIVRFDGRYFGDLWDLCKLRGLSVVADVHVHPEDSNQSDSDRAHPMISRKGHIALIVPHFARPPVRIRTIGIYRYLGDKSWDAVPMGKRTNVFHVGV
jgi:proteasome lid subunit RPN8/RPN11